MSKSSRAQRRAIQRKLSNLKKGGSAISNADLLYSLKYVLNEHQSDHLIEELVDEQYDYILGTPLPNSFQSIRKNGQTYSIDNLEKELLWYKRIILDYQPEINQFLLFKKKFEIQFLHGEYQKSLDTLTHIENNICFSQWSIEKRLLVAEYQTGFKKNKEVLASIISDQNDIVVNILSQYQSIRVERTISHLKYEDILDTYLENYRKRELEEYLLQKLNSFSKYCFEFPGFLLFYENNASVIDRYLMFREIVLQEFAKRNPVINQIKLRTLCLDIFQATDDPVFANIAFGLGASPNINVTSENIDIIRCLDFYTKGEYENCFNNTISILRSNPTIIELYEVLIKSSVRLKNSLKNVFNEGTIASTLLINLSKLLQKEDDFQVTWNNIHKLISNVGRNQWTQKLFAVIQDEFSSYNSDFSNSRFTIGYSDFYNPLLSIAFEERRNSLSFLDKLSSKITESITIDFWMELNTALFEKSRKMELENKQVDGFRGTFYLARAFQAKGEFETSLILLNRLEDQFAYDSKLIFNRLELSHVKSVNYVGNKDYSTGLEFIVNEIIEQPNFRHKLNNDFLIYSIKENEDFINDNLITVPILIHQMLDVREDINSNDLWISYDNFLCSHGFDYPHEIIEKVGLFDLKHVIYFLKHIARQSLFYNSYMFENQDELDNERIEICLRLVEIDPENLREYQDEISEISRDLLIRKGIKQIDESKIYVDVDGIRKTLDSDLKESFNRSINLVNLSIDEIEKLDMSSENVIIPYFGKKDGKQEKGDTTNLRVTSYSRFKQFRDMFYKIRDKFIASNEFGIDTSLSMRIRHGTLLGETRSVYEKYQLVTKVDSKSGSYHKNEYWPNQLNLDEELLNEFNNNLEKFSREVDWISDELKNKWLQVKTEKKLSEGLFDYSYTEDELITLFQEKYGGIEDYYEFFDEVISELWERTELKLGNIREFVSVEIKSLNIKAIDELSQNLKNLIDKNIYSGMIELNKNIISCRTGIDNEFDNIARWFRRTNNRVINDFELDLPIEASLRTLRRFYPDYSSFSPKINLKSNVVFEGEYFTPFSIMLQNLFENIIKHSELECEKLDVHLNAFDLDNRFILELSNNVSKEMDIETRNLKINRTREVLTKEISELTRSEGGTGYPKIKKILKIDLKDNEWNITLSEIENDQFIVKIDFLVDGLAIENDENITN